MPAAFLAATFLYVTFAESKSICPGGEPPVNCLVDPCRVNECPPGTTCKANYCRGCDYDCIPNGDGQCPKDMPPVECLVNPCDN
jgi:hypothetical protein